MEALRTGLAYCKCSINANYHHDDYAAIKKKKVHLQMLIRMERAPNYID